MSRSLILYLFYLSVFLLSDPNPILRARESGVVRKEKGRESATEAAPIALETAQAWAGSAQGPDPGTHTHKYLVLLKRLYRHSIIFLSGLVVSNSQYLQTYMVFPLFVVKVLHFEFRASCACSDKTE